MFSVCAGFVCYLFGRLRIFRDTPPSASLGATYTGIHHPHREHTFIFNGFCLFRFCLGFVSAARGATYTGRYATLVDFAGLGSYVQGAFSRALPLISARMRNCVLRHPLGLPCRAHKRLCRQFDNFSQTVKWPNLRKTLDFACDKGFTAARCWDTSTAFLYQVLEPGTRVFVKLPTGLSEFCGVHTDVAKLLRNAYGLPSAPAGFEQYRTSVLTGPRCKCTQCKHDEAVFARFEENNQYIIICTWVDDFLVLSNSQALYDEVYAGCSVWMTPRAI